MSFSSGKNLQNNVNLTEAQTLQNKTIDNTNAIDGASIDNSTITGASLVSPTRADVKKDTQANLETYAATATEGQLVYATDTKTMYQIKNNALSEVSGGAGGINYIENSDFEINLDGYTDDVNLTLARTTLANEILRGSASGKISKAAVDASGEEISIPFTVDRAGLASKITVSLEVDASDANYADGDLRLAVRQDPNGTPSIIRLNGEDIKGGKGKVYAQFQSDAAITEYELLIQCNSANALAYDVIIDDVKVGPREIAYGTLVTDWEDFTPTGNLVTNTTYFGKIKRTGDSADLQYKLEFSGTPNSDFMYLDLPSNINVDEQKLLDDNGAGSFDDRIFVGEGAIMDTGGSRYPMFVNYNKVSNQLEVRAGNASATYLTDGGANQSAPITLGAGDTATFIIRDLPIQGWSSNAISSEDLGGREVEVVAYGNSGTSVTASTTDIPFTTTKKDTTASWDGTGFTAPETGTYHIQGAIRTTTNVNPAVTVFIDGSQKADPENIIGRPSNIDSIILINGLVELTKGEELTIRSSVSFTLSNGNNDSHYIHIRKLASPQTILETETVAARYTSNSGQSIPSSVETTLVYEDLEYDTHNAYNTSTGIYTVPTSGYYQISNVATFSAVNLTTSVALYTTILLDGVEQKDVRYQGQATVSATYGVAINDVIYAEKGQEISIQLFQNSGGAESLEASNKRFNTFSIIRIK